MVTTTRNIAVEGTVSTIDSYDLVPEALVSDEADDLVIALQVSERRERASEDAVSLEESMRAAGLNPADFGLE